MPTFNKNTLHDYSPNGTPEDLKIGILHSVGGYWVSNEGSKSAPSFHVWIPGITHSKCDSAYGDLSLAVARCNYIAQPTASQHLAKFLLDNGLTREEYEQSCQDYFDTMRSAM